MKQKFTVENQPDLGQNAQLKLMPFQVDGVNWLCHNWNKAQNCILADEMGLVCLFELMQPTLTNMRHEGQNGPNCDVYWVYRLCVQVFPCLGRCPEFHDHERGS